jgi:hypothetical protein
MQRLTSAAIDEIEKSLGVSLPGLYRRLLVEVGFGTYGQKSDCRWNTTKELYHPADVRHLYADFFEDIGLLFAPYFPFGCDNHTQVLWMIDAARERAASISHDVHPADWPEEDWLTYEDWLARFLGGEQAPSGQRRLDPESE